MTAHHGHNSRLIESVEPPTSAVRLSYDGLVVSCEFPSSITIVADWHPLKRCGYSISVDLQPVVITVKAAAEDEAFEAASDLLQSHFGPDVQQLCATDIERDRWFGLNDCDAFLRVCAVFKDDPTLLNDDNRFNALR
ncbi:hypothetical protein [Streptomyces lydicus]|uniref:hypothetical protein n=1 Tax=Streptomyces lydicus TaxID=47763 RepID=UPI0036EC91D0